MTQTDRGVSRAAARAALAAAPVDLILFDPRLPDGSGLRLATWWRNARICASLSWSLPGSSRSGANG
jgi:DNA-binding response OmpR family regulator